MKIVIFEQENVKIKRKKAQPSKEFSTIGSNDNKIALILEDGKAYFKVFNPLTGICYIYSPIKPYANPGVNQNDSKAVIVVLLETRLKDEPSPYVFLFKDKSVASKFYACVFLAAKAAEADEHMSDPETVAYNSDYDATTTGNKSENDSVSSVESKNDSVSSVESIETFNPTQDFNVGAQALAQELLASYKWGVSFLFAMTELIDCGKVVVAVNPLYAK